MPERPFEEDREMLNLVTQETRYYILQYILAHPDNLPSLAELDFFIPKSKSTIREHLDILAESDIISKYTAENQSRDLPSSFFGLTDFGIKILKDTNLLKGKAVLQTIYERAEKPEKIERYEAASRPKKRPAQGTSSAQTSHEWRGSGFSPRLVENALGDNEIVQEDRFGQSKKGSVKPANGDILAIGCGGAGNNTINQVENIDIEGLRTVAINTDRKHLEMIDADEKLLIGEELTDGLGAGGEVNIARRAAENDSTRIQEALGSPKLVFVTAGMGGGTGTGSIPIVSRLAKEAGAIVIGLASLPFNVERARQEKAKEGMVDLIEFTDSVIVLDNNKLLDYVPNLPIGKAFSVMDQIIAETLKGLVETVTKRSLVNIDFADLATIFKDGDVSVVSVGEASTEQDTKDVIEKAISNPLLDIDINNAKAGLVHITGGPDLELEDAEEAVASLVEDFSTNQRIIWGARTTPEFKGDMRVLSIFTGYDHSDLIAAMAERKEEKYTLNQKVSQRDSANPVRVKRIIP